MRTKLGLALITIAAISVAMATQAYYIQAADAQAKLPNNSVSSETIVNGQVKTDDLGTDAVTTAKIKNGEVKTDDLGTDAVTTAKIKNGEVTTDDIKDGTIQSQDMASVVDSQLHRTIRQASISIPPHSEGAAVAECEPGEIVTGGGFGHGYNPTATTSTAPAIEIATSEPNVIEAWNVVAFNHGDTDLFVRAVAVCIEIG